MTAVDQALPLGHRTRAEPLVPATPESAIDLLLSHVPATAGAVASRAAGVLRSGLADLTSVQAELTEALIASQDRFLAIKALTQVNLRDVAGREAIGRLLGRALDLTGAATVLLLKEDEVATGAGDLSDAESLATVARRAVAHAPDDVLRTAAGDGAIIGSLDVDTAGAWHVAYFRPRGHRFATADLPLVEAINATIGVALAFAELYHRELTRAAVAREHELASALAQSAIVARPPVSARVEIFARTAPASLTGGDFYVFEHTGAAIWFAVGDVAGKGLPAAMVMTKAVAACRVAFLAHRDEPVTAAFARVQDELHDHLDEAGVFLTLLLGSIDEVSGTVCLVNAGHSPVVLVQDGRPRLVRASTPPMGILRDRLPVPATFSLRGDDCLVVGTDGLVEQEDPDEAMFGYDRFGELCHRSHTLPAAQIGEAIFATVAGFAAGRAASDDSTLVVLKHGGAAA
ncbi:PP2C family protein-serine/threonine phosphatase [Nakamurella sp.]|uniref:PP2C family protein-serine/threonine phosphatase n=1 Tax=Nakamurella sp. TaxID=1869182 RepID=UPI003B3A3E2F